MMNHIYTTIAFLSTRETESSELQPVIRGNGRRFSNPPTNMSIANPIDIEYIATFGSHDEEAHWNFFYLWSIPAFHDMALIPNMRKMGQFLDQNNYTEVCW